MFLTGKRSESIITSFGTFNAKLSSAVAAQILANIHNRKDGIAEEKLG